MNKICLAMLLLLASPSRAAALVGSGGAAMSVFFGFDPIPWIISAFGAVVAILSTPYTSRRESVANAIISVMSGVIVSPWLVAVFAKASTLVGEGTLKIVLDSMNTDFQLYVFTFLISAGCLTFTRLILPIVKKRIGESV